MKIKRAEILKYLLKIGISIQMKLSFQLNDK